MQPPRRPSPLLASGTQWTLRHGNQVAVVTEVGATLRRFTSGAVDLVDGFEPEEFASGAAGQVLAPWPNRLEDGSFSFGGRSSQAGLDDPEGHCAIHGLVRWQPWRLHSLAQNQVMLGCTLYPSPHYPFALELEVEYHLGREGLTVTTEIENVGEDPSPLGLGFHPYLVVGEGIDDAELECPATAEVLLDARGLPTGQQRPVAGSDLDFRSPRRIGTVVLDACVTGLARDGAARAWVTLSDRWRGRVVRLWVDDRFHYLQLYSGDTLAEPRRRRALAVEPMTCPPNALRTGRDLVVLEPGQRWRAQWGLQEG